MKRKEPEAPPQPPGPPKYLVRWQCPDCRIYQSGWITELDYDPRVCRGVPRGAPQKNESGDPVPCGAIMRVVHDERPVRMA